MQPNEQNSQNPDENQANPNPQPRSVSAPQAPPANPVSQPRAALSPSQQPAFATPSSTPQPTLPTRTGKASKLKTMVAIIGVVLIVAAAGAFLAYLRNGSSDPHSVFQKALTNGMSTSQLREYTVAKVSGKTIENDNIELDLSNMKDPRVYGAIENTALFKIKYKVYSSFNNEYISIEQGAPGMPKSVQNKWLMLKKNGAYVKSSSRFDDTTSWHNSSDITQYLYGPWPFGNFSDDAQKELTEFINSNNIYNYDAKNVKKTIFDGHKVYRYSMTLNARVLNSLTEKEAELMGLSPQRTKEIIENFGGGNNSTNPAIFYIDISTKRLVGIFENNKTQHVEATVSFSDYDSLKLPTEPSPQITIDQYDSAVGPPVVY